MLRIRTMTSSISITDPCSIQPPSDKADMDCLQTMLIRALSIRIVDPDMTNGASKAEKWSQKRFGSPIRRFSTIDDVVSFVASSLLWMSMPEMTKEDLVVLVGSFSTE